MTKDANLKRAARSRARLTGQSYAKVRAEMERDDLALAREVLGETPISIEQVLVSGRGYAEPYVHRVRTERRVVYLKHGPVSKTGGSYGLEAWAYRLCRAHGVSTPEVVGASEPGDELDYIATIELPGSSLWGQADSMGAEARRTVLNEAGQQLRALHEIELEGYGRVTSPGVGSQTSWCPLIETALTENLPDLVECGALTAAEADEIGQRLEEAKGYIAADGPSRLLHGDLEGDHLFAQDARFSGFIDFGGMQAGDPVYDLARFAWWDAPMLSDLVDGYGRDRITDDDLHIRMPAYLIANATRMVEELRRGIRPAQQAGDFIRVASATRFERSGNGITATAPKPQSPYEILVDAVRGKPDEEIDRFAESLGGYGQLCEMVFNGLTARLAPEKDCQVAFVLGDGLGWVLSSTTGKTKAAKRAPRKTPASIHGSPQDFLRWAIGELPYASAIAEGRFTIEGNQTEVENLLAGQVG